MTKLREKFRKKKIKRLVPPEKKKLTRKKVYVKATCMFHDEKGVRCTRRAIGKGQTCAKHGGEHDVKPLNPETTAFLLTQTATKFDPAIHPLRMIDLSRQGMSNTEIAAEMGIGTRTLLSWAENYEEFSIAFDIGQALHESWWLQKGKDSLDSRNFNTTLFKFLTGNKLGYADKVETKNLNMNTCGVLVAPAKQTMDEWEAGSDIIDIEGG
ncbi:MAG: helix-turn-helix domain-containing protein [bacterium]|nr:helix-turn-helix domain-containing protein [bacterium]